MVQTHTRRGIDGENHGGGHSEPDGDRPEIFSQEMPPADAKQVLYDAREVADVMQPLDLETVTG